MPEIEFSNFSATISEWFPEADTSALFNKPIDDYIDRSRCFDQIADFLAVVVEGQVKAGIAHIDMQSRGQASLLRMRIINESRTVTRPLKGAVSSGACTIKNGFNALFGVWG